MTSTRIVQALIFAFVALVTLGPPVEAAPATTPTVTRSDVLRVAAPLLPPWSFRGPDCRMAGIAIENLRRLAAGAALDIEFVVLPLESDEAALMNYRVDLFLGIADVNGPHHRSLALPVGFRIEHVAIGPAVREGTAPKDGTALRIGARTPEVARKEGYTAAQVRTGDIVKELAPALARGELDLLIGGREGLVFALMLQGKDPTTLRAQTVTLERRDLTFRLLPEAEAKWGPRLRAAANEFDWDRSYRQLRQRFLNPELVRSLRVPSNCPDAPLGTGQR